MPCFSSLFLLVSPHRSIPSRIAYLIYLFFRSMVWLAQILPFSLLYWFSDGVSFLLYRVIGYRKKLVFSQLRKCFPEKSELEIEQIARRSYQNLSDILVETFKGMTFVEQDIQHRFRKIGEGWEVANEYTAQGITFLGTGAHYANWEWGALAMQLHLDAPIFGVYKPIQNDYIDAYMRKRRGQWGLTLCPMQHTSRTLEASKNQAWAVFMVSDQSPSNVRDAHWLPFFGHETAFLHGLEKHARHYNYPVFYFDVKRVARGQYDVTAHLLAAKPADLPPAELTLRYAKHLENVLKNDPVPWLWTHDRWKRKKPMP